MIEVKQLRYTYPKASGEAVKGLDFTVEKGEIFGFLGPSGAGKSTTQKILIGLLKGYGGTARVMNRDLSSIHSDFYEKIGVCFESPNSFSKLTGLENLLFYQSLYSGKTVPPMELLESVGLKTDANTPVQNYSKGMKMRLNFCRALINEPDILFLDEPTTGQDPTNARRLKDIVLDQKAKGRTVFLTTHNMYDADELCDRVAFIANGQICLIDSPRQMKLDKGKKTVVVETRSNGSIQSQEFDFNGIGKNEAFLSVLRNQSLETIHSQEATLEDIFIEVTGSGLGSSDGEV